MYSNSLQNMLHFWLIDKTGKIQASILTPLAIDWPLSPTAKPWPFALARLLGKEPLFYPRTPPPESMSSLEGGTACLTGTLMYRKSQGIVLAWEPFPFHLISSTLSAGAPESALLGRKRAGFAGELLGNTETRGSKEAENNASQTHDRLPAWSKAALDRAGSFLPLTHLLYYIQFWRKHPKGLHSEIEFEFPIAGTFTSNKANANIHTKNKSNSCRTATKGWWALRSHNL